MNYERPQRTPEEQAELDRAETKQFWRIAVVFTIAIVTMTGIYVAVGTAMNTDADTPAPQVQEGALPLPDAGSEPTDSGDRGGSQQIVLMVSLFVVIGAGAAWVITSSRRKRRRLEVAAATESPASAGNPNGSVATPAVEVSPTAGSPEPR